MEKLLILFFHLQLEAKGTIDLDYEINFSNIDVHPIERIGLAQFVGFIENVPVVIANESDFEKNWDDLPIEMKLFIHINGKEVINTVVTAHPKGTKNTSYGTLNCICLANPF